MKNNRRRSSFGLLNWMLPVLMLAMLFAFAATPPAQAAPPATIELSTFTLPDGGLFLAQIDPPSSDTSATVAAPFYTDGAFIGAVIAGIMSLVALWSHNEKNTAIKDKTTAQKVSESLVIAIETATKIPAFAEKEKAFKQAINEKVTKLGVQPLVHRLVKDVTL
jgi:hypothetical protein